MNHTVFYEPQSQLSPPKLIQDNYGRPGTEYRTEIDSFSKITAYGQRGNGPAWSKIWSKASLIMEYGKTTDAFIQAQGRQEAFVWLLNKVTDSTGEYVIDRIDYTGNTATGLKPSNRISFTYESCEDSRAGYLAGSQLQRNQRLQKISVLVEGEPVHDYLLDYAYSQTTGRSLLQSVRAIYYNEANRPNGEALADTVFEWREAPIDSPQDLFTRQPLAFTGHRDNISSFPLDIDGDGSSELAIFQSNGDYAETYFYDLEASSDYEPLFLEKIHLEYANGNYFAYAGPSFDV